MLKNTGVSVSKSNKPPIDIPNGTHIQVQVSPSPEGILEPPKFVNALRIASDESGHTLYFFAIPADLLIHPDSEAQLRSQDASTGVVQVRAQLPIVAKIQLSTNSLRNVTQALQNHLAMVDPQQAVAERK